MYAWANSPIPSLRSQAPFTALSLKRLWGTGASSLRSGPVLAARAMPPLAVRKSLKALETSVQRAGAQEGNFGELVNSSPGNGLRKASLEARPLSMRRSLKTLEASAKYKKPQNFQAPMVQLLLRNITLASVCAARDASPAMLPEFLGV